MKIAVVGRCNIDLICRPVEKVEEANSNRASINYHPGGVGRNIAVNLRKMGCKVTLLTAAGDDMLGDYLRRDLTENGIKTLCIPDAGTGIYVASLDQNGLMARAFCDMSGLESVNLEKLLATGVDFSQYDGVVIDANYPEALITPLTALLREASVPYALEPVSNVKALRLKQALAGALLVKPNRFEAQVLTGLSCTEAEEASACAAKLEAAGAKNVIVSLGGEGFFWSSALYRALVPPLKSEVVNETGAGDALLAAAFVSLLKGWLPQRAAKIGAYAAAMTCSVQASVAEKIGPELFSEETED